VRKEAFTTGSYVHVYNRGNRKQAIVCEDSDRWRFLQNLYYFNASVSIPNLFRSLKKELGVAYSKKLVWLEQWLPRKPLVKIITFSLVGNHFHFILKEIVEGGITLFMRKLGTSMAKYFNAKYQEPGRLFQNSYKAKVINSDEYFKYLSVYTQIKNPFELYPKGFEAAVRDFDAAFEWVVAYPYCSLADYMNVRKSSIIDKDILEEIFPNPEKYKQFAKDCILSINLKEKLDDLAID